MAKPSRPAVSRAPRAPVAASKPLQAQPVAPAIAATQPVNKPSARIETKPASEPVAAPTAQAIAEAAYFLWLERGGNETVNWLEAERRLRTKVGAR